ncbi:zinc ribbon domain-containing protein [bacterium]|nr:zinc ribbon domain-containing protein [bacterium]
MARKSLGFVPLIWECSYCETQNPGPIKSCTNCGAPQPDDVEFLQVDEEKFNFIKDEALIRMAKAGPDVHCPYCGTRNPSTAETCSQCGADLTTGAKARETGGRVRTVAEADAPQPPQPRPPAPSAKSDLPPRKPMSTRSVVIGAIILIAMIVGGILLFRWLGQTNDVRAEVTDVYWEHSITIEEYMEVTDSDWWDEVPEDANVLSCSMEYRYTSEEPEANATEVCGDPYVVDTGTGVGEVVQDCVYEVYDDYCEYTTLAWIPIDPMIATGTDLSPYWPALNLTRNQREGTRDVTYQIDFQGPDQSYTYSTTDMDLFLQATPGSQWLLEVTNAGRIKEAKPTN